MRSVYGEGDPSDVEDSSSDEEGARKAFLNKEMLKCRNGLTTALKAKPDGEGGRGSLLRRASMGSQFFGSNFAFGGPSAVVPARNANQGSITTPRDSQEAEIMRPGGSDTTTSGPNRSFVLNETPRLETINNQVSSNTPTLGTRNPGVLKGGIGGCDVDKIPISSNNFHDRHHPNSVNNNDSSTACRDDFVGIVATRPTLKDPIDYSPNFFF